MNINETIDKYLTEKKVVKYKIIITKNGKDREDIGTLPELIKHFSYTLEVGQSWEHEKGNKKINMNPKSIKTLVKNLENAKNNAAKNGYGGVSYTGSKVEE